MTYFLYDTEGRYVASVTLPDTDPAPLNSTIEPPPVPTAIRRGRRWFESLEEISG